jgi:signal transduction histidine kinase
VQSTEGVITVGPFEWFTTTVREQPALIALREVTTVKAVFAQGFVVLSEALEGLITDSPFPIRVEPGPPHSETGAELRLDEDLWMVHADAAEPLALATAQAELVSSRFNWTFLLGTLCALFAGFLVVGLVWKADSLALQRARFAASAAHELRTPLAGLQLFGEMLAEEHGDPARRRVYGKRVAEEAERLGRIVRNVLGLSHLERDGLGVKAEPGDLAGAVREMVAKLGPALEARGARIELAIAEEEVPAFFDRDAVYQMLQNLLDNAEKYSREADNRAIRIELATDRRTAVLEVVDHGKGISSSVKRHLFRPFTHDPEPDAPTGLGLGLAMVRALAEKQEATVTHSEVEGGGSRFAITFRGGKGSERIRS